LIALLKSNHPLIRKCYDAQSENEEQPYPENLGLPQGGKLGWHFWNEVEKDGASFSDLFLDPLERISLWNVLWAVPIVG
jgi:hypothetical protein